MTGPVLSGGHAVAGARLYYTTVATDVPGGQIRNNADQLASAIPRMPNLVNDALERFKKHKVDFIDCLLAAYAAKTGHTISPFDKDLRKFKDITATHPGQ